METPGAPGPNEFESNPDFERTGAAYGGVGVYGFAETPDIEGVHDKIVHHFAEGRVNNPASRGHLEVVDSIEELAGTEFADESQRYDVDVSNIGMPISELPQGGVLVYIAKALDQDYDPRPLVKASDMVREISSATMDYHELGEHLPELQEDIIIPFSDFSEDDITPATLLSALHDSKDALYEHEYKSAMQVLDFAIRHRDFSMFEVSGSCIIVRADKTKED